MNIIRLTGAWSGWPVTLIMFIAFVVLHHIMDAPPHHPHGVCVGGVCVWVFIHRDFGSGRWAQVLPFSSNFPTFLPFASWGWVLFLPRSAFSRGWFLPLPPAVHSVPVGGLAACNACWRWRYGPFPDTSPSCLSPWGSYTAGRLFFSVGPTVWRGAGRLRSPARGGG